MVKSQVALVVKNLQETQARSLGREDPLEKEMATLRIFALEIPRTREAWWATVHGVSEN